MSSPSPPIDFAASRRKIGGRARVAGFDHSARS
jgi:hypothetical protein